MTLMKKIIVFFAFVLFSTLASANVLTFDDLPTPSLGGSLITSYQDFYFDSYIGSRRSGYLGYIDPTPFLTPSVDYTGFNQNIIFNPNGFEAPNQIIFSKIGTVFDFVGGIWSAGVTGDVTINFQGYRNSSLIKSSGDFLLQRDIITPITLNWAGIDYLIINSTAAVWVADNLNFSSVAEVPEPSSSYMMLYGLLFIVGFCNKQRNRKAD